MVYEETEKGLAPFKKELPDSVVAAMERADEDAIVAALATGQCAEEYLYCFPVEGKEVVGISTAGAFEIARLLGSIEVLSDIRAERNEVDYHVVVRVRDTQRNVTVLGAARQPLMKQVKVRDRYGQETGEYSEKPDPHAWTICLNKAQRNGILHLTPSEALVRIVEGFIARGKGRRLPGEVGTGAVARPKAGAPPRQPQPPSPAEGAAPSGEAAEGEIFPPLLTEAEEWEACWEEIREAMEKTGTTVEQMRFWFKKNYQLSLSLAELSTEKPPRRVTLDVLRRLQENLRAYQAKMGP